MNRLCIVVPTYNERENLPILVTRVMDLHPDTHLMVVDDNSPDGTGVLLDELCRDYPRLHAIHRSGKLGFGTAHVAGMRWAMAEGFDLIMTMDSDLSHDPSYISAMADMCGTCDVAIGSRYVQGGGTKNWTLRRRILSRVANALARPTLGVQVHDLTAGFRCYRRELLEGLDLEHFNSAGYSFLVEILYKCHRNGATMGEVPIIFTDRARGASKISKRMILEGVRLLLHIGRRRLQGGKVTIRARTATT